MGDSGVQILLKDVGISPPPKKKASTPDLGDGNIFGRDIFFCGYFDRPDYIFNVCLMLKAFNRTLHLLEVVVITKNGPKIGYLDRSTAK